MTARTPSQRGTSNRRKGRQAERDLCRWLRVNGFAGAERAVRTGFRTLDRSSADPGDITGTGPIVWSVKDCAVEQIAKWFAELDAMGDGDSEVYLLVHKRRGHASPARWWCWLRLCDVAALADEDAQCCFGFPVRMELGDAVMLLRSAGYGDELDLSGGETGSGLPQTALDHPGTRAKRAERGRDELRASESPFPTERTDQS